MRRRKNCAVQVFATDIDEEALKFARLGVYPESIVADVEADRLAKFFVRKDSGYQISDALRKSVVFAAQNLISRSAVFQDGHHQLPQSADLPGRRDAEPS